MKAIRHLIATSASFALATAAVAQDKPVDDSAAKRAALSEASAAAQLWIEGFRSYRHIPAISAALVAGDDTVWSKGFGTVDRAGKVAATPDTIYSVCSISKLFTAIALMQQWEEGRVRLDEPIATYLPWAKLAPDTRDSVPVTLRGALTHSAGLPRESDFPYWSGPDFRFPSQSEMRARIGSQAPLYPASTTFQYSNLGLTLVGETVEAVSGRPYAPHVGEKILAPMGLSNTRAGIPAELLGKQLAVGWGALEADGSRPALKLFDTAGVLPAAGFTSTAADLARFASWNLRVLRTGKAEILRASTLKDMQRVQFETLDGKTKWGLGYALQDVEGTRLIGHGGSCPGYRSVVQFAPKADIGVAVAMNAMDDPGAIAKAVLSLARARTGAALFDAPRDEPRFALADYAGRYEGQPWGSDFALVPWAGGLTGLALDGTGIDHSMERLKPLGKDRFLVIDGSGEERNVVTFQRDAAGRVISVTEHSNPSIRIAPIQQD